jgi:N-acetylmuramoyl-L-alanine amidase
MGSRGRQVYEVQMVFKSQRQGTDMAWHTGIVRELEEQGIRVVLLPGWETRRRPGAFTPVGVLIHHTASSDGGKAYANWLANIGRSDLAAPLCQVFIDRDGTVHILAAGRANHAGVARPHGSVAGGDGNTLYVGIECANNGVGEKWPAVQRTSVIATTAAILQALGSSVRTVAGHKETTVTGKIDPTGVDMGAFRSSVAEHLGRRNPAPSKRKRQDIRYSAGNLDFTQGRGSAESLARQAAFSDLVLDVEGKYVDAAATLGDDWQVVQFLDTEAKAGSIIAVRKSAGTIRRPRIRKLVEPDGEKMLTRHAVTCVFKAPGRRAQRLIVGHIPPPRFPRLRALGLNQLSYLVSRVRKPLIFGGDVNVPARDMATRFPGRRWVSTGVIGLLVPRTWAWSSPATHEIGSDHKAVSITLKKRKG